MDTTIISLLPSQTYMDTVLTISIEKIKRKGIMVRKKNQLTFCCLVWPAGDLYFYFGSINNSALTPLLEYNKMVIK